MLQQEEEPVAEEAQEEPSQDAEDAEVEEDAEEEEPKPEIIVRFQHHIQPCRTIAVDIVYARRVAQAVKDFLALQAL